MSSKQTDDAEEYFRLTELAQKAGQVNGRHYSTYPADVHALKQAGRYPEAIALLLQLIEAVEAQAKLDGFGIAPYYYDQLIIVYRKLQAYAQADAVRQRYLQQSLALAANAPKR